MPLTTLARALVLALLIPGASWPQAVVERARPGPAPSRPVPKGNRLLGFSITEPGDADFEAAFQLALAAGMEFTSLPVAWDDIEVAPGVYAPNPNFLAIANAFYGTRGVPIALEVNPIDTNNLRVPSDLAGLPFDHPALIQRYRDLLDYVFTLIPDLDLITFVIGNEIDATLGSDAQAWSEYQTFFQQTAAYARTKRSGLTVGSKITFGGHSGQSSAQALNLNATSDAVLVTHYPLAGDFTVLPPESVEGVFATMESLYPGRRIQFSEIGYPSGALCLSSEAKQADFVHETFEAWDRHRTVIELVEFVWLHDVSQESVDYFEQYYGISDPVFLEYLATLGLRTHPGSGSDKLALPALAHAAHERGW